MKILEDSEFKYACDKLGRKPNNLEQYILSAEWSEHCSYKSSKKHLKLLPTKGQRLIMGPGFDAGVIDVGEGYVITVHIESHNHPSAVEPHGGAATGVGGVLRDILSMGTRPIAILNALRFGDIKNNQNQDKFQNQWLFKNVVKGIADYGNCMGVPTVGGELEIDDSFDNYCLVDVAAIGHGKLENLIKNTAKEGDLIILAGNYTGKDGIHGASFASKKLEDENRSAVQIPDPFLEKNLMEATLEAIDNKCIKAIKDLGGGGLSCCLSETADSLKKGFEIELSKIFLKQKDMSDFEIMISESQERMLFITSKVKSQKLFEILEKYDVTYSNIGTVNNSKQISIKRNNKIMAEMSANLIANAPLLDRASTKPEYLLQISSKFSEPKVPKKLRNVIIQMLSDPSICSKEWIYQQFDYDVGIRTIAKPGLYNSAILKLDNGNFITFKLDGNSKHCFLDPYQGTLGCLAESLRNTICVGAEPVGIVDHLQFGNPEDQGIFWTFLESIRAIKDFCSFMNIPVVGGKVSLHNETKNSSIKPTPVIGALGLIEKNKNTLINNLNFETNDEIFLIGITNQEMGGSEYYESYHKIVGGNVPRVDLQQQKKTLETIKDLIRLDLIKSIHDCSKGGLIIALLEIAIQNKKGLIIDVDKIPHNCSRIDYILFSESHNRFIFSTIDRERTKNLLDNSNIPFNIIGIVTDNTYCMFKSNEKKIVNLKISEISKAYKESIYNILENR